MKPIYLRLFTAAIFFLFIIVCRNQSYAQCPDGQPAGGTAFDTTIAFEPGTTNMQVKFPQFDPQNGMVTCVRLCITITGVIDTVAMQNLSASPHTATFNYIRTDQITGPGLITPLSNSINQSYNYNLTAYDGIPGTGTDFASIANDTVLNEELCRQINDSTTIVQFYGTDSVAYDYSINVSTTASFSGGSNSSFVLTSALVNFHFEYCTCPPAVLPLNIREFIITKFSENKAELKWTGFDDIYANYHYEVEISKNGSSFSSIASYDKNKLTDDPYKMLYTVPNGENGTFYFRIKQVYSNGYVRYSNIKQVVLGSSVNVKFSIYPNPSSGIVGIKFDNILTGHYNIRIYNAQGQMVVNREVGVSESSYVQLGTLKSGSYWLRLTDKKSQAFCVNQLLIK